MREQPKPREPLYGKISVSALPAKIRVVSATNRLIMESCSTDHLLKFLHRLHVRFALSTTDKGYCFRLYQQRRDDSGNLHTISELKQNGPSPASAIANGVSEFLAMNPGDYHEFMIGDGYANDVPERHAARGSPGEASGSEKSGMAARHKEAQGVAKDSRRSKESGLTQAKTKNGRTRVC